MNKKEVRMLTVTIVAAIIFIVMAVVALQFYLTPSNQPNPLDAKNVSEGGVPTSSPQQEQQDKTSFQVGLLVNQLPYNGQYFSLYYNDKDSVFTLYIDPRHKQEGNDQFTRFLNSNGIKNQSWLQNLTTTNTKPK